MLGPERLDPCGAAAFVFGVLDGEVAPLQTVDLPRSLAVLQQVVTYVGRSRTRFANDFRPGSLGRLRQLWPVACPLLSSPHAPSVVSGPWRAGPP